MRIGIDVDDTIADTYEVAMAYAQKFTINELEKSTKINNITSNHHSYVMELHNWTYEESKKFWDKYYCDIIMQVKPYTLSVETINQLKKDGHEIVIVTARWPEESFDVYGKTMEWLKKNKIPYDDIVFNATNKGKVALEKNLDLFIDDSFKNCTDVANTSVKTYIIETRTNKGLEADNITRVYSWPDIYDRIKKEENI